MTNAPCKRFANVGGLVGMDTFRRWSHRIPPKRRERELADLLARVLRQYHQAVGTETLEHYCDSCATDVAIYVRKAEALGVTVNLSA